MTPRRRAKGCSVIRGGLAHGVGCGASPGGGAPSYWAYSGDPTTRRGAVAVVVRPPGISGQPVGRVGGAGRRSPAQPRYPSLIWSIGPGCPRWSDATEVCELYVHALRARRRVGGTASTETRGRASDYRKSAALPGLMSWITQASCDGYLRRSAGTSCPLRRPQTTLRATGLSSEHACQMRARSSGSPRPVEERHGVHSL